MKKIREGWRDFSIWKKTFALMATIMGFTIAAFGYLSYHNAAQITIEEVTGVARSALVSLAGNLENQFSQAQTLSENLAWNGNIRSILSEAQPASISQQKRRYQTLCDQLVLADHYSTGLFLDSSLIYSKEHQLLFPIDDLRREEEFAARIDDRTTSSFWDGYVRRTLNPTQSTPMLACFSKVRAQSNIFRCVGVVAVFIPQAEILRTLDAARPTEQSAIFILDGSGERILGDSEPSEPTESWEVLSVPIQPMGWSLCAYVPDSDLTEPLSALVKYYVTLCAGILCAALLLSLALSRSLSRRISDLVALMKNQGASTRIMLSPVTSRDEIGVLQQTYNQMLTDNRMLTDRLHEMELSERSAQLKALQSQINPHFLYNILDTMNWMALETGAEKLSGVITSLADYFRMNLRKTDDPSTLAEEFTHAELYLSLQKYRMGDALEYSLELPEAYASMRVMKLTLQPLAENAVMHGVRERSDQRGRVRIYTRADDAAVYIHVEDDGPGFPEGFSPESAAAGEHFGLYLTEQRLKLAFGEEGGLAFGRSDWGGARVTVRIPRQNPT